MRLECMVVILIAVTIVGPQSFAGSATSFDLALTSARANVATDKGKAFDIEIGKQFGERHVDTMGRCTEGIDGPGLAPFELVMKLGDDGKVREVLVRPETPVAACLRTAVASESYRKPPRAGYWVRIGMSFTQ